MFEVCCSANIPVAVPIRATYTRHHSVLQRVAQCRSVLQCVAVRGCVDSEGLFEVENMECLIRGTYIRHHTVLQGDAKL